MSMILAPNFGGPLATRSDPYWANVVQLQHFWGANGSGTFANNLAVGKGTNFTNTGGTLSSTAFKWGPTSLRVTAGNLASAASSADYNFGTGDFTIEFWVNPDNLTLGAGKVYYDQRDGSNTAAMVPTISATDSLGSIQYFTNGTQRILSSTGAITAAAWNHVAVARVSSTTRMFVNGTQVGSNFSDSNTYVQGSTIHINSRGDASGSTSCYYQDVRMTKGTGRYSANFTAPTAPFPNV